MSYRLVQFGTTTLPQAAARWEYGPRSDSGHQQTIGGGVFRVHGSGVAPFELPVEIRLDAEIVETSAAAIKTSYDALAALSGKRSWLWRQAQSGTLQWCYARLEAVRTTRRPANVYWQPIQMIWTCDDQPWHGSGHGGAWNFDDGYLFDNGLYFDDTGPTTLDGTSPDTLTVTNSGNVNCDNAGITVTVPAGKTPITALKIGISGVCEFTFGGTIAAGKSLIIDCGAKTVLNDGVDAWNSFALTASHAVEPWLRLASGANSVVVTYTGGDAFSEVTFTFSDAWA